MSSYTSTEGERQAAADCLNQLVAASQQIQRAMRETQPSGILALDSSRDINAAVRMVGLHQLVASDHLASFAGLLSLPGSHGLSLAALDRSFLETWARAWRVMQAPTSTRAEYRARAMVVTELEAGGKRGIGLLSAEPIGGAIKRAMHEREEIKVLSPEIVPGPTALVKELLQQSGVSAEDAAAIYSHLLGVAHGESVFTESLREMPVAWPVPVIALPRDDLAKYCVHLFSVTAIATWQLIRLWGLPPASEVAFSHAVADVGALLK